MALRLVHLPRYRIWLSPFQQSIFCLFACAAGALTAFSLTAGRLFANLNTVPLSTEFRKRQIFGLLIIAAAVLVIALLRAPAHTIFPHGWWHVW
ncbi:MAG TPA: hypothetical protein VFA02_14680 [Pseudacidobacterium sp.]|nr:hypothetical protein [Pseudacidobacterium sp.]